MQGHTDGVNAFKHSEALVYSVSKDRTVRMWDLRTGSGPIVSERQDSEVTYISNNVFKVLMQTDRIVIAQKNGTISFLNKFLQVEQSVQLHEQEVRCIDYSSKEKLFLAGSFDGHLSLFGSKTAPFYCEHNEH